MVFKSFCIDFLGKLLSGKQSLDMTNLANSNKARFTDVIVALFCLAIGWESRQAGVKSKNYELKQLH